MTDPKRALWHLRKLPLFAELGPDALSRLADHSTLRETRRRDVIYLPNDPAASAFFVCNGRARISKVTRDGKSLTLGYFASGDLFGEACLLGLGARAEMADAVEACLLLEMTRPVLERLTATNPGIGLELARIATRRRLDVEMKLERLLFRDVASKLAELLLELAAEHGVDAAGGRLIALKITHQEIANLIGTTRETVSTTLSEFRKQRWVDMDGRRVVVTDVIALRALA